MHDDRPSEIPWPPILLFAAVAGALVMDRLFPLSWPGLDDGPARFVGLAFGVAGLGLFVWSIRTLHQHNTTVLPHQKASALVTTGPYARLRNPIYLADVFILLGLVELTKNIWFVIFAVAFAILVTWLAIRPEEAHLEARFGEAYRDYKNRTRRWI